MDKPGSRTKSRASKDQITRVKELGAPSQLLADSNSALSSLAAHAGISRQSQVLQETQEPEKNVSNETCATKL